jgi:putative Ca2+/H+ antiporter (TMEM165/GDT1 family)
MNALMVALAASALSAFGGPWWRLSAALSAESPRLRAGWIAPLTALIAAAFAAIAGGWIAAEVRGPGMQLFLALSLLLAAGAMLWPNRPMRERVADRGPAATLILLLALVISDSAPFIILAVAAWTGLPLWAGVGGALGMLAAILAATLAGVVPSESLVRRIRLIGGAVLLVIGAWVALSAMRLI